MAISSLSRNGPVHRFVRQLRRTKLLRDGKVLSDGHLLESFLASGDEAAFETLVRRHGPMVLGVCRRVIGNLHDAEDALQAVFLVLAKKARSIVPRELVGNWLYGAAYRTALQARSRLNKHRAREIQVKDMPQATASADLDVREVQQALDRELSKLPDKYRVPMVLCELESRSRKEVAAQLKIPEGTLSSRLATGKQLLARRLSRCGIALSVGALAALLPQKATAAVPSSLVVNMVKAAGLVAAGQSAAGFLSAHVIALSQGVLKTMLLNKLKVFGAVLLGFVLGGVGIGALALANGTEVVAQASPKSQSKSSTQEDEPLNGRLLLEKTVQNELRLSKNQIKRLETISTEADPKDSPKRKQIAEMRKRAEALQKEIEKLQNQINNEQDQVSKVESGIEKDRTQALGKAAPEILSAKALGRLRQIQRQQHGLRELLQDVKMQAMLKLDDEQLKKVEAILKAAPAQPIFVFSDGTARLWDSDGRFAFTNQPAWQWGMGLAAHNRAVFFDTSRSINEGVYRSTPLHPAYINLASSAIDTGTDRQLLGVLSGTQKKTLFQWLGEPYGSSSWHELWKEHVKKGR